mmetsp:Transcript_46737/g.60062  ORF Transcript_46737/g.60062 Transcript_46737/m.60062 type:complete len:462 (-) Transcript_46737:125-1510(-)
MEPPLESQASSQSSWKPWFQQPKAPNLNSNSFTQFCDENESIVFLSPVWKRRAMSCHLRILILTSTPRLLYVDHTDMTLKGEVPWTAEQPIELLVSSSKTNIFDVLSPLDGGRSYHFEVYSGTTKPWETMINTALSDQKARKGDISKKAKTRCLICQKQLGLMRRGYSCDRCKQMVCSECSEDAHISPKEISSPAASSSNTDQPQQNKKTNHGVSKRWCEDCVEEALHIVESVTPPRSSSSSTSSWLGGMGFTSRSNLDSEDLGRNGGGGGGSSIERGMTELTQQQPIIISPKNDHSSDIEMQQDESNHSNNHNNHSDHKKRAIFQKHIDSPLCNSCHIKFNTSIRRHHCRACGLLFCNKCSSATFPLESYDMYPQRVCNNCAWHLFRNTTRLHDFKFCKIGIGICCWSYCLTVSCAQKIFSKDRAVFALRKIASPFGPLWGRFKLNFLLRDRGEGKRNAN